MQGTLRRTAVYAALIFIGMALGAFYTDRQYQKAATRPLIEDDYVRAGTCPSHTLRRLNQVLTTEDASVPVALRRELEAERRSLVAEICPPSRR